LHQFRAQHSSCTNHQHMHDIKNSKYISVIYQIFNLSLAVKNVASRELALCTNRIRA
jgi:hypothetical protein